MSARARNFYDERRSLTLVVCGGSGTGRSIVRDRSTSRHFRCLPRRRRCCTCHGFPLSVPYRIDPLKARVRQMTFGASPRGSAGSRRGVAQMALRSSGREAYIGAQKFGGTILNGISTIWVSLTPDRRFTVIGDCDTVDGDLVPITREIAILASVAGASFGNLETITGPLVETFVALAIQSCSMSVKRMCDTDFITASASEYFDDEDIAMEGFELLGQGAEARLYKGKYLGKKTLVKERFEKKYRHPDLDARLTKDRIRAEARAIVRAKAAGVETPAIFLVDVDRRSIFMEYIDDAQTLKSYIEERIATVTENDQRDARANKLARALARILARLHSKNIIHGDLTTSNVLVRKPASAQVHDADHIEQASLVLVDFGLSRVESTSEDKAVDLYVLERSLLSSHSELPDLFPAILSNYVDNVQDKKQRREIVSKYEEVRARGRKRLMIG